MNMKNILIIGSGSVGTFLGTKLSTAGNNVQLLGKRKLQKLNDSIEIDGERVKLPPKIESLPNGLFYDIVFCTTKLYDTQKKIQEIKDHEIRFGYIVFIQNGLVNENFYGDLKIHKGFCTLSIFEGFILDGDKLITHTSKLGWQVESSPAGEKIVELLKQAGINAFLNSELSEIRAEKMILVASVNALSALYKKTLGELVNEEITKSLMDQLILETYQVLKNDYDLPELEKVKENVYETINANEDHYSSMYQDIISGRKTEIEFLNGLIVEIGKKKGVRTPVNESMFKKIKEIERETDEHIENKEFKIK